MTNEFTLIEHDSVELPFISLWLDISKERKYDLAEIRIFDKVYDGRHVYASGRVPIRFVEAHRMYHNLLKFEFDRVPVPIPLMTRISPEIKKSFPSMFLYGIFSYKDFPICEIIGFDDKDDKREAWLYRTHFIPETNTWLSLSVGYSPDFPQQLSHNRPFLGDFYKEAEMNVPEYLKVAEALMDEML